MLIQKRLMIKDGLLHNNNFIIENSNVLTIDKNMSVNFKNFFEFAIITDDQICPATFLCDQIVYDPIKYQVDILNTRSLSGKDQVTGSIRIREDEIVSLYSFGEDKILAVISKEN